MTDAEMGVLEEVDELLCEIISGNQGSFKPPRGTVVIGQLALDKLRKLIRQYRPKYATGVPE